MTGASPRGPAYRIVTKRLVVRCWDPSDASRVKESVDASLEHLRPWMPWAMAEPTDLSARILWLRKSRGEFDLGVDFTYGIFDRDETMVIGGTGLHTRLGPQAREIGYWIRMDRAGQGLATEVAAALTRVAFVVDGVTRVEIRCDPRNTRSAAIPRKLGYQHEATLRRRILGSDGQPRDAMIWTLLSDEFPASPAASAQIEAYDAAGLRIL
jgi:RimJ/RimL family protein N-acetyltransferase